MSTLHKPSRNHTVIGTDVLFIDIGDTHVYIYDATRTVRREQWEYVLVDMVLYTIIVARVIVKSKKEEKQMALLIGLT